MCFPMNFAKSLRTPQFLTVAASVKTTQLTTKLIAITLVTQSYFNIRPSFHFTCGTDEEITDFEIYCSITSNDVILMFFYPHIFKWFMILMLGKSFKN